MPRARNTGKRLIKRRLRKGGVVTPAGTFKETMDEYERNFNIKMLIWCLVILGIIITFGVCELIT